MLPWRTRGFLDANPRSRRNKNKHDYFGHKSDIKGQCTQSIRFIITVYYIIVYFKYCMLYIYIYVLYAFWFAHIYHYPSTEERERERMCVCVFVCGDCKCIYLP